MPVRTKCEVKLSFLEKLSVIRISFRLGIIDDQSGLAKTMCST